MGLMDSRDGREAELGVGGVGGVGGAGGEDWISQWAWTLEMGGRLSWGGGRGLDKEFRQTVQMSVQ